MRYSAVQEDCYGVGLGQETPINDVDESMMAATEPGGNNTAEEGSMISNLPLLFANGYPTSLDKITLPELERFCTFMAQCSLGKETSEMIDEPKWWSKEIKFQIPLVRPKTFTDEYMANLKKLVFRCYTYHRSEYLLRFCSYLSQYPHDKLEYVNNWDSTTSLFLKTTGKLLVTFRNENMNYDKKAVGSKRLLLVSNNKRSSGSDAKSLRRRATQKRAPSPAMVEPAIEDIYLCDNCDDEFVGLHRMKEHEKLCYPVEPRPPTPIAPEPEEIKQDQFMDYFNLKSSSQPEPTQAKGEAAVPVDGSSQNRSSSRIRGSVNLSRCPAIPFSSPAGIALAKRSKMMTEDTQQERLDRVERHLTAPPITSSVKPKWLTKCYEYDRWQVTYKPNREKTAKSHDHVYNFADYRGKPALDIRSQLMYLSCKPIYVAVEKLTAKELDELKRDPSRYKSPERQIVIERPRSPSVETVKSAALGDENNPIVIDLEDDEPQVPIVIPRFQNVATAAVSPILPSFSPAQKPSPSKANLAQTVVPLLPTFIQLSPQLLSSTQVATITLPGSPRHPNVTKTATITLPIMNNLTPRKTPTVSVPPYNQTVSRSSVQTTPSIPPYNKPSPKSVKLAKAMSSANVSPSYVKPSPRSVKLSRAAAPTLSKPQQQQQPSRNVAKRTRPTESIVVVDLCSSDDEVMEEDVSATPYVSIDENCEPMRKSTKRASELRVDPSYLCDAIYEPNKLSNNSSIFGTADSTRNWASGHNQVDGNSESLNRDYYV